MTPPETTLTVSRDSDPPRVSLFALMCSRRIAWSALKVSLVVGTVLNVINNGRQFWEHHPVSLLQVSMNYVVPFCVSSYSAARNEAQRTKGD